MNTLSKLFVASTFSILASVLSAVAGDSGFGYSPGTAQSAAATRTSRAASRYAPEYFRPTQRYFGKGYTVTYRFIPWNNRMRGASISTWDIDEYIIPTGVAASTFAMGSSPRVTYFNQKPAMTPSMVPAPATSIVTTPKPLPPVAEGPAKP